jgi:PhnB protein
MKTKKKTPKKVKPIPSGMNSVTSFLLVKDAAGLIKFMKSAFGGELTYIMKSQGQIMHATVKIGNTTLMIADAMEPYPPMPCQLYLYVEDMDTVYKKALKAGGTSLREPITEFYGDRAGAVQDAWGNHWWIATHVEDVSDEEIKKREKEMRKKQTVQKE